MVNARSGSSGLWFVLGEDLVVNEIGGGSLVRSVVRCQILLRALL